MTRKIILSLGKFTTATRCGKDCKSYQVYLADVARCQWQQEEWTLEPDPTHPNAFLRHPKCRAAELPG